MAARHRRRRGTRCFATTIATGALCAALVAGCGTPGGSATPSVRASASQGWPTGDWPTAPAETAGLDSSVLATGLHELATHGSTMHSLLVVRGGTIVLEATKYPYDDRLYHDVASVTKSITTTLIGIAAGQGRLDLDAPVLSFFPDVHLPDVDQRKARMTVRHLASMTSGLDCRATTEEVTLARMQATDNWVGYTLDLPMVAEPGEVFAYCSPGMHLLSAILTRATGKSAHEFARENLFAPLGITDSYWPSDAYGYSDGWGDLALHPRDMARIGLLMLRGGRWGDRQVVPAAWVAAATSIQSTAGGEPEAYGYGWWVSRPGQAPAFFRADGRRGQHILVIPSLDAVIVSTGGGFSLDEAVPFVLAAATDGWSPLPANPAGAAQLDTALRELSAGPAAHTPSPLPPTAAAISGRRIEFEHSDVRSAVLTFDGAPADATATIEIGREETRRLTIGLDGRWRPSVGGRPILARGTWSSPTTFVLEIDEGPGFSTYPVELRFTGDEVTLVIDAHGLRIAVAGHLEPAPS